MMCIIMCHVSVTYVGFVSPFLEVVTLVTAKYRMGCSTRMANQTLTLLAQASVSATIVFKSETRVKLNK